MNKIAKILSVVLSAVLALSVSVVMLVSAFAATTPVLSLNVLEDNDESVVVEVRLDKGCFNAIDFQVKAVSDKIGACLSAYETDEFLNYMATVKRQGGQGSSASYANTGKLSAALTIPYDEENGSVMQYTFAKNSADRVTNEDLSLVVTSCKNSDGEITAQTVNNLPSVAEVTTVTTTTQAPAETEEDAEPSETTTAVEEDAEPSETSTAAEEDAEPSETSTAVEEDAEPSETTTAAEEDAEPSETTTAVEENVEPSETTTAVEEDADYAGNAEADTTASVAENATYAATGENDAAQNDAAVITTDGDSVNPKTGDSFTTTAAFASLLAISAAVVVALRKKEN